MDSLFLLQYTCFLLMLLLALMLLVSRFQQNDTTRQYERSRWMLFFSMLLLTTHYALQMFYRLRASSDEIGTVFNIVFYSPTAFFVSYSIMEMECGMKACRNYAAIGGSTCLLVVVTFLLGWLYYGSFAMPVARYIMYALFFTQMLYFIFSPVSAIMRNHRRIVDETGGDITPYARYAWSSYLMLSLSSFSLVFGVISRISLFVIGPLMMLSLFVFILSFVALGYNLASFDEVLSDAQCNSDTPNSVIPTEGVTPSAATDSAAPLTTERSASIGRAISRWLEEGGFRDSTVNMAKLSIQLGVARRELSDYFDYHLHSTFRVWLSEIRFREAKRLIIEHPDYSNDYISQGCGFSSRSQLYKIFSTNIGMTPREWREKNCRRS